MNILKLWCSKKQIKQVQSMECVYQVTERQETIVSGQTVTVYFVIGDSNLNKQIEKELG